MILLSIGMAKAVSFEDAKEAIKDCKATRDKVRCEVAEKISNKVNSDWDEGWAKFIKGRETEIVNGHLYPKNITVTTLRKWRLIWDEELKNYCYVPWFGRNPSIPLRCVDLEK